VVVEISLPLLVSINTDAPYIYTSLNPLLAAMGFLGPIKRGIPTVFSTPPM
jgi:hypothetical protein